MLRVPCPRSERAGVRTLQLSLFGSCFRHYWLLHLSGTSATGARESPQRSVTDSCSRCVRTSALGDTGREGQLKLWPDLGSNRNPPTCWMTSDKLASLSNPQFLPLWCGEQHYHNTLWVVKEMLMVIIILLLSSWTAWHSVCQGGPWYMVLLPLLLSFPVSHTYGGEKRNWESRCYSGLGPWPALSPPLEEEARGWGTWQLQGEEPPVRGGTAGAWLHAQGSSHLPLPSPSELCRLCILKEERIFTTS